MKTIKMTIPEFLNFRKTALLAKQWFDCQIDKDCNYNVTCHISFLKQQGWL